MGKDFLTAIKKQSETKDESLLNIRISEQNKRIQALEDEIKNLQNKNTVEKVHIDNLYVTRNVRDKFEYEEIQQLADNIEKVGQLQPTVITNNDIVILGHRRYEAIKLLNSNNKHDGLISVIRLEKSFNELGEELFDRMQVAENEERKNLDNFQLSSLFTKYIKNKYKQNEIAELFNKSKFFVSSALSLQNIPDFIQTLLKEIQYYGMSNKKLHACNLKENDRKPLIIGINTLVKIARAENDVERVKVFIDLFGSKLTEEELIELGYKEKKQLYEVDKFISTINAKFKGLKKIYKDENSLNILNEAQELLEKFNKKIESLEK